jgi:hypothetical protein
MDMIYSTDERTYQSRLLNKLYELSTILQTKYYTKTIPNKNIDLPVAQQKV